MSIYKHTDGKVYKSDANAVSPDNDFDGVSLNGGAINQPIVYITGGTYTVGAAVTAGEHYIVGATAEGDINPIADKASGWRVIRIGYATTTSVMMIDKKDTGVTI